jgi:glycosyltransferase involved in cell wall biosynthesis
VRVLFLSAWYPYPADNGVRIRILNVLRQLAADNHEITLLSFARRPLTGDALAAVRWLCSDVRVVPYVAFQPGRLRAVVGLFSAQPRSFIDTYSPSMADLVRAECAAKRYDLIIASTIEMAPYALLAKGVPRILEEVELATIREQALQGPFVRRARYGLTWYKTARFVRQLVERFDACTVVSPQEHRLLAGVAPEYRHIAVVPNGVDLEGYPANLGIPEPDTLIHSGALSYRPNYDAVDHFLREVFPLIRRQRPTVTVRITGSTDGLDLRALPDAPGTIFTGYLPDIRPAVAQSWVSVVPLRIGGGTRLKILEAMALGTPVVSTPKGAEGLDVRHGEHLLIADTPEAFAAAVLQVLADRSLRAQLAAGGRRLVEERYGWQRIGQGLRALVRKTAGEAAQ